MERERDSKSNMPNEKIIILFDTQFITLYYYSQSLANIKNNSKLPSCNGTQILNNFKKIIIFLIILNFN